MKKIFLISTVFLLFAAAAEAQNLNADEDIQSWNDLQIIAPMTKKFDYFFFLTGRFGDNVQRLDDQRVGVGFAWKPLKNLTITPFYENINARNSSGVFHVEKELNLRGVYRFPTKKFGLAHRSQYEYRYRFNGNSWRYRGMMTIDRDLLKNLIPHSKVYASDEVFYDSNYRKFSRNRLTVGVTKTFNKFISLDVYLMRQNDGFSHPGDLSVVGTNWKLHF